MNPELVPLPWWIGGPILGLIVALHTLGTGRLLSVSGIFGRILRWRDDDRERRAEMQLDSGSLADELLAATVAQFGPEAIASTDAPHVDASRGRCESPPTARLPVSAGAVFLVCLALGGALSAWSSGGLEFSWGLGTGHERIVASPLWRILLPAFGGLLVGFGAKMAGGCTSNHGLAGCARLQPGSLAATAAFFAGGAAAATAIGALW